MHRSGYRPTAASRRLVSLSSSSRQVLLGLRGGFPYRSSVLVCADFGPGLSIRGRPLTVPRDHVDPSVARETVRTRRSAPMVVGARLARAENPSSNTCCNWGVVFKSALTAPRGIRIAKPRGAVRPAPLWGVLDAAVPAHAGALAYHAVRWSRMPDASSTGFVNCAAPKRAP